VNLRKFSLVLVLNLLFLLIGVELVFTAWYVVRDGKFLSVNQMLSAEQSSFDRERDTAQPCNRYKRVLKPHPYLAFMPAHRPECKSFVNNSGHRGPDVPFHKNGDHYTVMVLGGSVANSLFQHHAKILADYYADLYPGKTVVILNGALEAWKQPQQLFMLQLYGEVIDEAISVEGYNEMMFSYRTEFRMRLEAPFLPGYRKANTQTLSQSEAAVMFINQQVFDFLSGQSLLARSKTIYFLASWLRSRLEEKALQQGDNADGIRHLGPVFALPADWGREQRVDYHIDAYRKYVRLMSASAKELGVRLSVFIQPAPALDKQLSEEESQVVGDLGYAGTYRRYESALLDLYPEVRVFTLLGVFSEIDTTIYSDGIHYQRGGPGGELVMKTVREELR
jgi:hypothetical protein